MCGIAGVIDFTGKNKIDEIILKKMASPLKFRGPDSEGYYLHINKNTTIGLAHKRLSIIDLSSKANQPMHSNSKKTSIVFNGEIYNYNEVKNILRDKYEFKTNSDTEVIIASYEVFGLKKSLELIEGMFVFVLYDHSNNTCYAARDRFGEKPLYYHYNNGFFTFSSDIRSFKYLNLELKIDPLAVEYYFQELTTPSFCSIYKGINKLQPASYIQITNNSIDFNKYWQIDYTVKHNKSIAYSIEKCESLLKKSVTKTLVSDVPVGTFLSGGIDSSLISIFAAENYSKKIDTFSVGFEFEKFNELKFAKQVADKINSNHHEIVISNFELDTIDQLIYEYGEPFADSSMIPTYYISKFAGKTIKVVLGGDAGDELFAGYRTYNQGYRMQLWQNNKWIKTLIGPINKVFQTEKTNYLLGIMNLNNDVIASALNRGMSFSKSETKQLLYFSANAVSNEYNNIINEALSYSNTVFDALLYGNIRTRLVNDYFVKTDRATMYNSLELRTPFADKNLFEFCSSIPYNQLMFNGNNKYITKKIAEKYFSKEFVHRKKMGFEIPIGEWIKTIWKNQFYETILEKQDIIELNYNYIKQIIDAHCSGSQDNSHKLWAIYVFKKWLKENY